MPLLWAMGLRKQGIDREGEQVVEFFEGVRGIVADLSCGTGIVTRRLLRKTTLSAIALDYSAEMLAELQSRCRTENLNPQRLVILRADVTALPFQRESIDAIYSGAAMHCWPDAEAAMAEIFRCLKPAGKLYLTTFLKPLPSLVFRFFTPEELRKIAEAAGFRGDRLQVERSGIYATLTACK